MGLIAWYPLNGTGESKGLITNKFSIGASEYGDGGKIGKYYLTSNKIKGTGTISGIENFKQVSIAFWFKKNKIETTAWQDFMKFYAYYDDGSKQAGGEFRLEQHTSSDKTQVYADWYCSTTSTSYPSYTGAAVYSNSPQITDLGWHHTVLMLDFVNHKCTSYFDGILNKIMDINTNAKYITGGLYIGDADIDAGICDLRLYDNLLSVQEIKDLNNCLILHYPLNSGYGNENLLVNTYEGYYGNGTVLTDETYNGFKIRYLKYEGTSYQDCINKNSIISPTANTYYTVSFWAKGNCGISNFFYPNNCASGISSDGHTTTSVDGNCYISLTSEWKRYWITWKTRSDVSGAKNIVVGRIQNQGTGAECYIAGLKFEEGDKNSVWSPNEADDLYSILGYDSTTVYDTSGFGNNAEKINTPIYTSDTVLYDSCINFNQSGYLKNTSLNLYANELTICFWVKMPNTITTQHFLFSTHNDWTYNGIGMWRDVSTQKGYYLLIKSNTETTFSRPFIGIDANTWTFISISYTGKQYSVYKNGSLYQTVDYGNDGQVYNPVLYLGNSLYNGTPSTETDEALMSDFRIYATALSAEDIKQLYQTKAKIDKNGNVYCNQFIDNDCEEELLTTQKMTFHQANSQGTITYETNGNEVINIITMDNTISSWKYLFNNAFDKTKIINHKLKLSFKYKTNVSTAYSMAVKMCKGDSTKPQTINIGSITLSTNWQEYNGIITFGNTYDNQGIYIHTGNFCGGNLYIKDLSLKIYENNNKTDFTKKSQIITGELSELDSNKTYVYKNSKIVTNQIIEI